jgi:hypothetical protein
MATRYGACARLTYQRRPTLLQSPKRCALTATWTDAGSLNASKIFAVPITKFQSDVLRSLAAHRSPDSYIAGGVAINREGPRYSADIDIFHDSEARLESAARTDATVLTAEGYIVRFTIEEFQALVTEQPIDVPRLHRRIRSMIEGAESFIARLPSDAVGVIFMEGERTVQPDVKALDKYQRNPGAPSGFWPTSPEISRAMLERYSKPKP